MLENNNRNMGGSEIMAKVESLAATMQQQNPRLTREAAVTRVLNQNPQLYSAYLAANPAQTTGR